MSRTGTYVYCVVAAVRRPRVPRGMRGPEGLGPVRLLDVESGLYVAVADAPLSRYGAAAINRRLGDLESVSRAAVAHERVIETFIGETAVLPMKLFTIFASDARVLEHLRSERRRIASLVKRVADHQEWGVRLILDRAAAARASSSRAGARARPGSGAAYLSHKKAQRDAAIELTSRARATVAEVYDRLSASAKLVRRRPASDVGMQGGSLLLDAAFLVGRRRAASFKKRVAREARILTPHGYGLTLNGPWPPYTFVQD